MSGSTHVFSGFQAMFAMLAMALAVAFLTAAGAAAAEFRCGQISEFGKVYLNIDSRSCSVKENGRSIEIVNNLGAGRVEFRAGEEISSRSTECSGEGCGGTTATQGGCWAVLGDGDCWLVHNFETESEKGEISIYISSPSIVIESFGVKMARLPKPDDTPPEIVAFDGLPERIGTASGFDFIAEFSEPVSLMVDESAFAATNAVVSRLEAVSANGVRISVIPDGGGDVALRIPEGLVVDEAGNANPGGDEISVDFDRSPPILAFEDLPDFHDGQTPFGIRIHFSEPVQPEDVSQALIVTNGMATALRQESSFEFAAEIQPADSRDVVLDIPPGAVRDLAGNFNIQALNETIAGLGTEAAYNMIVGFDPERRQPAWPEERAANVRDLAPFLLIEHLTDDPLAAEKVQNRVAAAHSVEAIMASPYIEPPRSEAAVAIAPDELPSDESSNLAARFAAESAARTWPDPPFLNPAEQN